MTTRSSIRRGLHAFALVAALTAAALEVEASQQGPGHFDTDWKLIEVGTWLEAAKAHAPGQADAPMLGIAGWSNTGVRKTVDEVIRTKAGPDVLAKGLVMHTDIAIMERMSRDAPAALGTTSSWLLLDGRSLGPSTRSIHWDIARRIASALIAPAARECIVDPTTLRCNPTSTATSVNERPPGEKIARAWVRTVVALEHDWGEFGLTHSQLAFGTVAFPDDPVLSLYAGTLHQAFADARVQRFIATSPPAVFRVRDSDTELGLAEAEFRRALEMDRTLAEARIRLAHVVTLRKRPEEAALLAREALAGPLPPFLEFYAAMVLGRSEAALGRAAEARAAFERAAVRYPKAQSPQVALTHVALIDGRTNEGLETAIKALRARPPDALRDPWDEYFRLHEPDARTQLAALRASVR